MSTTWTPATLSEAAAALALTASYLEEAGVDPPVILSEVNSHLVQLLLSKPGRSRADGMNEITTVCLAAAEMFSETRQLPRYDGEPVQSSLLDGLAERGLTKIRDHYDRFHPVVPEPIENGATMTAAASTTIAIDPSFIGVINPALAAATKGKITDITTLLSGMDAAAKLTTLEAQVSAKDAMIADLNTRLVAASVKPMPTEIAASGELPTATVVMKNAASIFYPGKKVPALGFDIPTLEWSGGNPNVPQINPHYRFDLKRLATYLSKMVDGENVMATGHTGTGKTTFFEQIAARLGFEFYRVNFDSEITRLDLIGRDIIKVDAASQKTVSEFVEGILPKAMVRPAILCLDEIDFIRSDVSPIMYRLVENLGIMLNEDGGRVVLPHALLRIVGTANTKLAGDEFGAYQGAKPQPLALRNRFTAWIEFDYLTPKQEVAVLQDYVPGLDTSVAETLIKLATEVRKAFNNGQILDVITPRDLVSASRLFLRAKTGGGTDKEAMDLAVTFAFINRMTRQDAGVVRELSERITK